MLLCTVDHVIAKLTSEMKELIRKHQLAFIAVADEEDKPT